MENRNLIIAVVLGVVVVAGVGVIWPLVTGRDKGQDEAQQAQVEEAAEPVEEAEEEAEEATGEPALTEESWEDEETEDLLGEPVELDTEPVVLENELFTMEVDPRGGAITALALKNPRYVRDLGNDRTKPIDIVTRAKSGKLLPLLVFEGRSKSNPIGRNVGYVVESEGPDGLVLVHESRTFKVTRTYRLLDDPYQVLSVVEVENLSSRTRKIRPVMSVHKYMKEAKGGGFLTMFRPQLNVVKGMCMLDGDMERRDIKKMAKKGPIERPGHVDYLAVDELYFMSAILPEWDRLEEASPEGEDMVLGCKVGLDGKGGLQGSLDFGKREVGPGETLTVPVRAYLGPKEYEKLDAAGHGLGEAIDYGWFGALARFLYVLLNTFDGWVHNWALAIIMLTLLVKLVLSPLTHWSFKSMQKMQAIKPLIDDLNARYPEPEDRDKKSQALMALYKTHKINPLMGCLPMMLQLPIWIALYRMLANTVELYHTPLIFWIHDLTQPDPYYVMPLVLGASMFAQQKLTPTTADSQQAKIMMYTMPIMFTFFMLFLPAGLNLYILVNTVLTIAQQRLLYRPKVVTADDKKVTLMSDMDPGEIEDKKKARKDKDNKPSRSKKGGKGRKKR